MRDKVTLLEPLAVMSSEPVAVIAFRKWLDAHGAYVHPDLRFVQDASGMSIHAAKDIPPNTKVVSCPFSLAVTPGVAKRALTRILRCADETLDMVSENALVCTYLVMHWIIDDSREETVLASAADFIHLPYLHTLPSAAAMRTALQFNENELRLLKGTNLFAAIVDRHKERDAEWKQCRRLVSSMRSDWEDSFTWERYLTVSTYLSSRAFPSTLLSRTPSSNSISSSYPVLLPGLDAFNHSRSHRVSWIVDNVDVGTPHASAVHAVAEAPLQVSLVVHDATKANNEIFNHYGPKPNSELILGYGFSLSHNPDDTILLKVGGHDGIGRRWEVGRDGRGVDGLWDEIRNILNQDTDEDEAAEWEVDLETAEMLKAMTENKLRHLPQLTQTPPAGVRKDVFEMIQNYVLGQKEILQSLLNFVDEKRESSVRRARDAGVELTFEDEGENV